jgi:parallel beta-helix repeat protein
MRRLKLMAKRFRRVMISVLIAASLLALVMLLSPDNRVSAAPDGLTPHDPICINSNDNFIPANGVVGGSGTGNAPYIIEGWNIIAENAPGILIENTTAYFIIRNCYVHGGWADDNPGILLNAKNGEIDNNTVENNESSINLLYSANNLVENNIFEKNSDWGIFLYYSSNNRIVNNLVENNPIGVAIRYSDSNIITSNRVKNTDNMGIFLSYAENTFISNNLVENNYYDGISLYYSSNSKIDNNLVENSEYGIVLTNSENNTVDNCTVGNNKSGIVLFLYSNNNIIKNNITKNNGAGIDIETSNNNTVSNNIVKNNSGGISLSYNSYYNLIYNNNIVNNENQGYDECSNYWNKGYPSGGNYWSDYAGIDADNDGIGDTPYSIRGGNNQDNYPLMALWTPSWAPLEEVPHGPTRWPLIAGVVGAIVVIGVVAAVYVRRR